MTKGEINKNKIQEYAVYLSTKFKHVVLCWATGCGKSLAAIKSIDNDIRTSTEEKGEWNRWYIVVAERQHIKNWEDDIHKHGYGYLLELGYIEIFCYNSLHKYKERSANIILDEAHSVTDLRLDCLTTIKYDKIISLSATLEPERERQLSLLSKFHKYTIDTSKAIRAEILPAPTIVKVEFELSPHLKERYQAVSQGIDNLLSQIKQKQITIDNILRVFPESPKIGELRKQLIEDDSKLLQLRINRKTLLANSKTTSVRSLQQLFISNKKRYIIFTGGLSQTNKLGRMSGSKPKPTNEHCDISSSNSQKTNDKRVDDFNKGLLSGLVCYKMLRQGTNLSNIQVGVITQLDSKQLSFVQMMGKYLAHIP